MQSELKDFDKIDKLIETLEDLTHYMNKLTNEMETKNRYTRYDKGYY